MWPSSSTTISTSHLALSPPTTIGVTTGAPVRMPYSGGTLRYQVAAAVLRPWVKSWLTPKRSHNAKRKKYSKTCACARHQEERGNVLYVQSNVQNASNKGKPVSMNTRNNSRSHTTVRRTRSGELYDHAILLVRRNPAEMRCSSAHVCRRETMQWEGSSPNRK